MVMNVRAWNLLGGTTFLLLLYLVVTLHQIHNDADLILERLGTQVSNLPILLPNLPPLLTLTITTTTTTTTAAAAAAADGNRGMEEEEEQQAARDRL